MCGHDKESSLKYSKRSDRLISDEARARIFCTSNVTNDRNSYSDGRRRNSGGGGNKIIRFKQPILISLESHSKKLRMKRNFYFHFYSFSFSLSPSLPPPLSLSPQIRFVHCLPFPGGAKLYLTANVKTR